MSTLISKYLPVATLSFHPPMFLTGYGFLANFFAATTADGARCYFFLAEVERFLDVDLFFSYFLLLGRSLVTLKLIGAGCSPIIIPVSSTFIFLNPRFSVYAKLTRFY
jgi:hypothetical protein